MSILHKINYAGYKFTELLFAPLNYILAIIYKAFRKNTKEINVLHISYPVHIAHHTVELLQEFGISAQYLAIGNDIHWKKADKFYHAKKIFFVRYIEEFILFWSYISKFNIIHSHFALLPSQTSWEARLANFLRIKLVVHHRGCSSRSPEKNKRINPLNIFNICSQCDYMNKTCINPIRQKYHNELEKYASLEYATTPDLLDFKHSAKHLPFFSPSIDTTEQAKPLKWDGKSKLKILHWTNHPGIEGTYEIERIINELISDGYLIELTLLSNTPHSEILKQIPKNHLTIGKMKMGYYANAQIESIALGVPTITYIKKDYLTSKLAETKVLILSNLIELKDLLKNIFQVPESINVEKAQFDKFILQHHNNKNIILKMKSDYKDLLNI